MSVTAVVRPHRTYTRDPGSGDSWQRRQSCWRVFERRGGRRRRRRTAQALGQGRRRRQAQRDRRPRPRRQGQDQDPQAGQAQCREGCRDRPPPGRGRTADPPRRRRRWRHPGRLPSQGARPQLADRERIASQLEGGKAAVGRPREGRRGRCDPGAADRARWHRRGPRSRRGGRGRSRHRRSRGRRGPGCRWRRSDDHRRHRPGLTRLPCNAAGRDDLRRSSASRPPRGSPRPCRRPGSPCSPARSAGTWPRQAKLAAAGDWSALRRYIDSTK